MNYYCPSCGSQVNTPGLCFHCHIRMETALLSLIRLTPTLEESHGSDDKAEQPI